MNEGRKEGRKTFVAGLALAVGLSFDWRKGRNEEEHIKEGAIENDHTKVGMTK